MTAQDLDAPQGYCFNCKALRPMVDAEEYTTSGGRFHIRGRCKECGGRLNRAGRLIRETP